ncbi:carboxypeptidase-like regulatory domain-containing protein [Flavobacteriales bacterium]|nr:carboxypeptidase-like regulatory domain-containing protein [Flavobacteriales bacterium]
MPYFFVLASLFIAIADGLCQQTVVCGVVSDSSKLSKLHRATVLIENSTSGTTTDQNGFYSISIKNATNATLYFSYLGYQTANRTIKLHQGSDTIWLDIELKPQIQQISTFSVNSENKAIKVYGSQEFSIADFEFHGNDFICLTYEKNLKKGSAVLWLNRNKKLIDRIIIPSYVNELYSDYRGRIYAISDEVVYQLKFNRQRITLIKLPVEEFNALLRPCIDSLNNQIAYTDYQWFFPKFNYYLYNPIANQSRDIYQVKDTELYHLYRMQYYFMHPKDKVRARNLANEYNMEKQDIAALMSNFTNTLYYEPLYAPLFVVNDTALIFDHYANQLLKIDRYGNQVDSLQIGYHQVTTDKWSKLLVMDEYSDEIYSISLKNGRHILSRINTTSGKVTLKCTLTQKYAEQIHIKNGYVYYVYRPFESLQKKYLYKEMIVSN